MTESRAGLRLKILAGLVAFMFAALTMRLWYLQVLASDRYKHEVTLNSVRLVPIPAPRGLILDATGKKILVGNKESIEVTVQQDQLGDQADSVLFQLSQLLGVSVRSLQVRLKDKRYYPYQPIPVATGVTRKLAFYLAEHQSDFPGVKTVEAPVRTYPFGVLAAQILGSLGPIQASQLTDPAFAGYDQNDVVGQSGLEAEYEHRLAGTKGVVKYRVNSAGQNIKEIGREDPQPGNNLVTNISVKIQQLAAQALTDGMQHSRTIDDGTGALLRATNGAVVVMDPTTGAVKAMVSLPSFNPSLFVGGVSAQRYRQLNSARAGYPLLNRVTAGQYPPGSTYKPFIALSGLRDGVVNETQTYDCAPTYTVGGQFGTSQTTWHNWSALDLGYMNIAKALIVSCDTVFYPIGYSYWSIYYPPTTPPKLPLERDLGAIGFGHSTHVDVPGEQSGRVPDPAWKASIHERYPNFFPFGDWFPGDFVNMSIGQGDTLVTPLQEAVAYSAIANDGKLCAPEIASAVQTPEGKTVKVYKPRCHKTPFPTQQLTYVRNALAGVPTQGTAASAFTGFPFSQVSVAGKTGTAQQTGKQDTSWFAAMTKPVGHQGKQYVIVAVVEQGGHGSTTAAPIVRRIIEGLYGLPVTPFTGVAVPD